MDKVRIQKKLAEAGIASRRKAEDYVREGRVLINNELAKIGDTVTEADTILFDGEPIKEEAQVYIMLHKPKGYISSRSTKEQTKTIFDLVPSKERLFSVGRLDVETEGLIILTNDGDFAQKVSHPKEEITKTYMAWVHREIQKSDLRKIATPQQLKDDRGKAYTVENVSAKIDGEKRLIVTVKQGKYHVVRKILSKAGFRVLGLKRTAIGKLELGDLSAGKYRLLTKEDREAVVS
ncbi:pseudouridine synthase [Patescibacteria group bacterium]